MNGGVGEVLELLRHDRARDFGEELPRPLHRPAHALFGAGQLKLGAQQGQHLAPLDGHAFGHDQDQGIALGGGDEGEPDAGVAAGRFDQRGARLQKPARFKGGDHGDADPVLHAGGRIEELKLAQHRRDGLQLGRQVGQAHQRGVAHGVDDAVIDAAPPGAGEGGSVVRNLGHGAAFVRTVEGRWGPSARSARPISGKRSSCDRRRTTGTATPSPRRCSALVERAGKR